MKTAKRIESLPPYLFAELDRKVVEEKAKGVDVISFGIGDPDRPTPAHIVEAGQKAMADPSTHQYPSYFGMPQFRAAVAAYYERRFGVQLDPATEVLPLIGSKEGIAHLATAFVDPGDKILIQDPGYPVYQTAGLLAGGVPVSMPLTAEGNYLPQLEDIGYAQAAKAKVMWINYPSNPTSAVCDVDFMGKAVEFADGHGLLLAHDAAYVELTYDGFVAPSVLEAPRAKDTAIEFGSLSKTYNMTGWRIGWVVGAAPAIEAIGRVKTNIDSGIFNALQMAGIAALEGPQDCVRETIDVYARRRNVVVDALRSTGLQLDAPKGAIYVWVPVPEGYSSVKFCEFLLNEVGVVIAPGSGYGPNGEGYVRFSLTLADDRIGEGMERVAKALGRL